MPVFSLFLTTFHRLHSIDDFFERMVEQLPVHPQYMMINNNKYRKTPAMKRGKRREEGERDSR